jgi:hypothetical protein
MHSPCQCPTPALSVFPGPSTRSFCVLWRQRRRECWWRAQRIGLMLRAEFRRVSCHVAFVWPKRAPFPFSTGRAACAR